MPNGVPPSSTPAPRTKPLLRGVSHEIAAGVALAGLVALVLLAPGPRARVGALVYGFSLVALFSVVPIAWLLVLLVGLPIVAFETWMAWSDRLGVRIGDIFADTQVVDGKVVTKIEVIATHAFPMSPAPPGPTASRAAQG